MTRIVRVVLSQADLTNIFVVCDFTPEEFVQSTAFRYISDAITKEEALELLKSREATKQERTEKVLQQGYPAYTTSVGCKWNQL